MIKEYVKFFINGGILGLVAWGGQLLIYHALPSESEYAYAAASAITYLVLMFINFLIQRAWIFKRPGMFPRFVVANLSIMLLVSLLSPVCRLIIDLILGGPWGNRGGFVMASLMGSIPSFLIKRYWVFRKNIIEN